MRVTGCSCATSAPTRAPSVRARRRADGRPRAQRRRQDQPARGAVLRLHRALVPDAPTSARSCASARRPRGSRCGTRGRRRRARARASASSPARPKRMTRRRRAGRAPDRRRRRGRWSACSCPTASSSSRARRRCAARTSTSSSPRCGPPAPATRRAYSAALAQRNALLAAIRAGRAGRGSLPAWDAELARHGHRAARRPRRGRRAARRAVRPTLRRARPRAARPSSSTARARRRRRRRARRRAGRAPGGDLERGFTGTARTATSSRCCATAASCAPTGRRASSASALLALLLAERDGLADERGAPPLMLLDDVMSELDATAASCWSTRLRGGGQSVITTTDLATCPAPSDAGVTRVAVVGRPRPAGRRRRGGGSPR